ncbi:hypothetical protein D3C75_816040 [compost metagenome]
MKDSVQITGSNATLIENEQGRYASMFLAVKAVIRAAKDIEITTITVDGTCYSIMDEFSGGLLQDCRIIHMITGFDVPDANLFNRVANAFSEMVSTWLANRAYQTQHTSHKASRRGNTILDSTTQGPFDARLEPLSYRSIARRTHKH